MQIPIQIIIVVLCGGGIYACHKENNALATVVFILIAALMITH